MNKLSKTNFQFVRSRGRRRPSNVQLRLVSLIDMMTILLIFLLKSYSSEGQLVNITQDLRLPVSTAQTPARVTSVISITSQWILLDGRPIEQISAILNQESLLVQGLFKELQNLRRMSEAIGDLSTNMSGFQGIISIQADRDVTFDLLKRIMLTCGQVGYSNMLLTVLKND
jgi:biopolymer transport protein ExbD